MGGSVNMWTFGAHKYTQCICVPASIVLVFGFYCDVYAHLQKCESSLVFHWLILVFQQVMVDHCLNIEEMWWCPQKGNDWSSKTKQNPQKKNRKIWDFHGVKNLDTQHGVQLFLQLFILWYFLFYSHWFIFCYPPATFMKRKKGIESMPITSILFVFKA